MIYGNLIFKIKVGQSNKTNFEIKKKDIFLSKSNIKSFKSNISILTNKKYKKMMNDRIKVTNKPKARYHHSAIVVENTMFIFGKIIKKINK